jgi:uncharacterized protein YndB with AHSA1/START domain
MAPQSRPAIDAKSAPRPSLTFRRHFNASPAKVWTAWTDPEEIVRWFGPAQVQPGSMRADIDLRVGGQYSISFTGEGGEYFQVDGVYREVVPNERLVFSWTWHSTPERESLVTVSLTSDGTGTLLTLLHEQFFDAAARDNHARGWSELFDRFERHFA